MPEVNFDLDALTVEEVEILEDVADMALTDMVIEQKGKLALKPGVKVGKLLRAITYIEGRRSDPNYTLEQAGKVLMSEDRPTNAGAASKGASPASSGSSSSRKRQGSRSKT